MVDLSADRRRRPVREFSERYSTRAALLAAGVARRDVEHALNNGVLVPAASGIYVNTASPGVTPGQAVLETLTARSGGVVSHHTAAALWGLTDDDVAPPFHLSFPTRTSRVRRRELVTSHYVMVPEEFISIIHGVPVASPAWAWLDLALESSEERALVLADRVLSRRNGPPGRPSPLTSRNELSDAIRVRGRANGIRTARAAVELASDKVDSPQETRLRYYCHLAGLPAPEVNPLICGPSGYPRFRPDLALSRWRLAIQYEGAEVHSEPERVLKDIRRQETAEELGWREVRISKDHMRNRGARAVQKILAALRAQGYCG